jgi:hypothetical protein
MVEDNFKLKYIKYKKKYIELKKIQNNLDNIEKKIIILPNEFNMLGTDGKKNFTIYEIDKSSNPISYIKNEYIKTMNGGKDNILYPTQNEEEIVIKKNIITPDEYYLLSDSNKSKYEIYESDYEKFPNRVVPKNYIKIN